MKIKELETILSISRSNIRFYEKQGLFTPERRENNYREYTEGDIHALKTIIVLRKMGFTVEEIRQIQCEALPFAEGINRTQQRLEEEIDQLQGSVKLVKQVAKEHTSFDHIDINRCWNAINTSEKSGEKFVVIWNDFLELERNSLDSMLKYVFFHDFKKSRVKHGTHTACVILLAICVLRGIGSAIRGHTFWSGFLYPFFIALVGTAIILPLFLLGRKCPKSASAIATVLLWLIVLFFASIFLLLVYGINRVIINA